MSGMAPPSSVDARKRAGILFIEDFETASQSHEPVAMTQEAVAETSVVSEVALELAREEGYRAGFVAGAASARAELEAQTRRVVHAIGEAARSLREAASLAGQTQADALARLMLSAIGALFPTLARRHGPAEAAEIVRILLPDLAPQPILTVWAERTTLQAIQSCFTNTDSLDNPSVTLSEAAGMLPGDVRIGWPDGGARRDGRALLQAVLDVATSFGFAPEGNAIHSEAA